MSNIKTQSCNTNTYWYFWLLFWLGISVIISLGQIIMTAACLSLRLLSTDSKIVMTQRLFLWHDILKIGPGRRAALNSHNNIIVVLKGLPGNQVFFFIKVTTAIRRKSGLMTSQRHNMTLAWCLCCFYFSRDFKLALKRVNVILTTHGTFWTWIYAEGRTTKTQVNRLIWYTLTRIYFELGL